MIGEVRAEGKFESRRAEKFDVRATFTLPPSEKSNLEYFPVEKQDPAIYFSLKKLLVDLDGRAKEPLISSCITIYNESRSSLKKTFSSVIKNYASCSKQDSIHNRRRRYQVCMVIDGLRSLAPTLNQYLVELEIYDPSLIEVDAEFHLFRRQFSYDHLVKIGILDPLSTHLCSKDSVELIVGITSTNAGKLNSHNWYFRYICAIYNPLYCIQIDVGVEPGFASLVGLIGALDADVKLGAVAANSLVPDRPKIFDLLHNWQFVSFDHERFVCWPVEVSMGFLSVLPGQMHALRWEALAGEQSDSDIHSHDPDNTSVLDNYFKDVSSMSVLEANKYLAEDRIMGMDLVYGKKKSWSLGYSSSSKATVDECNSWGELLRQRRRWICGSLACKPDLFVKAINKLKEFRSARECARQAVILIYFLTTIVLEWFGPAICIGLYFTLSDLTLKETLELHYLNIAFWYAHLVSIFMFGFGIVLALVGRVHHGLEWIIKVSVSFQAVYFFSMVLFLLCSGTESGRFQLFVAVFFLSHLVSLFISSTSSPGRFWTISRALPLYTMSKSYIGFILQIYAILNFTDTSWGTKGLTKPINNSHLRNSKNSLIYRYKACISVCVLGSNWFFLQLLLTKNWTIEFIIIFVLINLIFVCSAYVLFPNEFRGGNNNSVSSAKSAVIPFEK